MKEWFKRHRRTTWFLILCGISILDMPIQLIYTAPAWTPLWGGLLLLRGATSFIGLITSDYITTKYCYKEN